jgi:hypothetical protein
MKKQGEKILSNHKSGITVCMKLVITMGPE